MVGIGKLTLAMGVKYWSGLHRFMAARFALPVNRWARFNDSAVNPPPHATPHGEPLLRHLTDDKLCRRKASVRN